MRIAPPVTALRGVRPEASPERRTPGIRGRARQRSSAGPSATRRAVRPGPARIGWPVGLAAFGRAL